MADDSPKPVDLFGDPWTPPRDPRGRKSHRRTAQVAEKVAVLRATGSTAVEIALRIGLSEPTLRKYYFRELEQGSVLARQVLVERMWDRAIESGNVAAAKVILAELSKGDAVAVAYSPTQSAESKSPRLGKKEERQQAAEKVGGIFAPGAAPKALSH